MPEPATVLPPIGSRWRERPPYQDRIITVVGYTDDGRVRIKSSTSSLTTTARADRFGGGVSGYRRLEGGMSRPAAPATSPGDDLQERDAASAIRQEAGRIRERRYLASAGARIRRIRAGAQLPSMELTDRIAAILRDQEGGHVLASIENECAHALRRVREAEIEAIRQRIEALYGNGETAHSRPTKAAVLEALDAPAPSREEQPSSDAVSPFARHQVEVMDAMWPHVVEHAKLSDDPDVRAWAEGESARLAAPSRQEQGDDPA